MPKLRELLQVMIERRASDLHIGSGSPPQIRVDGELVALESPPLTPEESKSLCYEFLTPEQVKRFEAEMELDTSFSVGGVSRFRANLYRNKEAIAGAFRAIPFGIPPPDRLGIPAAALELVKKPQGLILVTGPTGSGKSTTLASLLDQINSTRHAHIVTVEDPIEFTHDPKKSFISQREVGQDTKNFSEALKHVLRQDPNVILIGELWDLESIAAALTIAETGHLVFATLHTNGAVQTVNRIIDVFPPHQQAQIRTQLSFILEGVLSQLLIPKVGGGRVLATEILIPNLAIRNLIRENKVQQIQSMMQTGQQESGMLTMDQSLASLVQKKLISPENALARASDPAQLKRLCQLS
ncbi:MAG: type IV pilus twitching motility protein PilT [Deltaproteobacteria bacterium]|nr:type IV pilus twitching motility protein PilT [Deltaproteobacteria bacterium]